MVDPETIIDWNNVETNYNGGQMKPYFNFVLSLTIGFLIAGSLALTACQPTANDTNTVISESPVKAVNTDYTQGIDILYHAKTRYEYPKAIEHLEAALNSNPDDFKTQFHLIYAYLKRSKYAEAGRIANKLSKNLGALSAKERLWFEALNAKINDDSTAEIAAWKKVVSAHPLDRWAWYELAVAHSTLQQYANAATSGGKALEAEADPAKWESSWVYYLISKAYYRSGQYEKGAAAAEKGKHNQTTWRATYFRQSLAELKSGAQSDHKTIIAEYIEVSNKEGRNKLPYTHTNIALFYHELGDLDNAEIYARKAFMKEPQAYQHWALGFVLADNGKVEEALQILDKAASEFTDNNYIHAARGWTLYRLGRLEDARTAFKTAKAHSKRRNYSIEGMAKIIDNAISNPNAPSAPQIPWLG